MTFIDPNHLNPALLRVLDLPLYLWKGYSQSRLIRHMVRSRQGLMSG